MFSENFTKHTPSLTTSMSTCSATNMCQPSIYKYLINITSKPCTDVVIDSNNRIRQQSSKRNARQMRISKALDKRY